MKREIITTKDNSKTLLIPEMKETYHSSHGALTEANHIFIKNGINQFKNSAEPISIFEMGFGTGLNAILTYRFANKNELTINYSCIEKYPVSANEMKLLNYPSTLSLTLDEQTALNKMHQSINKTTVFFNNFSFNLVVDDIKNFKPLKHQFDIIYFDAFAPSHQPNLWQKEVLTKMYKSLKPKGFLITYCAQGQFKRDLKAIGFEVVNLPGPPGKREITKAIKN
jgi:tRNA U34 5-methylaminomethyl-2-thiouridine-forming methyltransferase MnmC